MCINHLTGPVHIFMQALLWQQQSFQQCFVDDIICTEFLTMNSLPLFEFNVFIHTIDSAIHIYHRRFVCFILSLIVGQMDPERVSDIIMAVG